MEMTLTYDLEQFEPLHKAGKARSNGVPKTEANRPGAIMLPVEKVNRSGSGNLNSADRWVFV